MAHGSRLNANFILRSKSIFLKTDFLTQLNTLAEGAQHNISEQITKKKEIILFSATGDEDEEWTTDIFDEVPDFPYYGKNGFVDYGAVKEVRLKDHGIEVTAVLKGDNYPEVVRIMLSELDAYSSASLADYLNGMDQK